jgi:hypothetical protein
MAGNIARRETMTELEAHRTAWEQSRKIRDTAWTVIWAPGQGWAAVADYAPRTDAPGTQKTRVYRNGQQEG